MRLTLEPIAVRRYGVDTPQVALIHGGPGGQGYMAPLGLDLADEFSVLEPLQRTSGDVPLSVARHVADLHDVLATLGRPVCLVGSSWGAMLALTYAARHPQRVRKVVAVGCGTFDRDSRKLFHQRMAERTSPEVAARRDELRAKLSAATEASARNAIFAEICQLDTRSQSYDAFTDDLGVIEFDLQGHHETWTDAIRLQETGIQPAEFVDVTVPVAMLHGGSDPHPGRSIYDSLAPIIRDLSYTEFAHCGHIPWIERLARDEFLRVLRDEVRASIAR